MNSQVLFAASLRLRLVFLAVLMAGVSGCQHTNAAPPIPITTVMQTIREYGRTGKLATVSKSESTEPERHSQLYDLEETYQAHIKSLLAQKDFASLEAEVHDARLRQTRVQGGVWKLYLFYEAVGSPPSTQASDSDWQGDLAELQNWIKARPNSAAARIALAVAYVNYAGEARGAGYANTVSKQSWARFYERTHLAKAALIDAAKVDEKCPFWYEVMQIVATSEGWDKQQTRELFDNATAFAPNYYHFYREYANYLLPKWYGEEGEMQRFAEEASAHLPDPSGSIVYFELGSMLACQCDDARNSLDQMSWPRIKQGYQALVSVYGTSKLKANRFAYMSYLANDKTAAREAFSQLGDDWEQTVWQGAADYQVAKKWASGE